MSSSGASLFAEHPTISGLYVGLTDSTSTNTDPVTLCIFRGQSGNLDTTANTYHHGCIAIEVDGGNGVLSVWVNTGTYASPSWTEIGNLPPGDIQLPLGKILIGNASGVAASASQHAVIAVPTNGTTPVNVFGTTNGFAGTITGVYAVSQDATAGSISLVTNVSGTETKVADKIQKDTTIGSVKGTVVSATAFSAAGTTTVVSNSAGNAIVFATYTT